MFTFKEMLFSSSFAASMMLVCSLTNDLLPPQLTSFLSTIWIYFFGSISSNTTLIIDENCSYIQNEVFEAAEIYLRTKISPSTDTKKITLSIEKGREIIDHFENIHLKWRMVCSQEERNGHSRENRHFELIFAKKSRDRIVDFYLPFLLKRAKEVKNEDKVIKIYSQTFSWMMNPELKKFIIDDLDKFVKKRDFYKRLGKAWKRGYLLYDPPPGTGKSSLIDAIANYLQFDIYDLDFSNI